MTVTRRLRIILGLIATATLGGCGGSDINKEDPSGPPPVVCPAEFDPVCALTPREDDYQFRTFSNGCQATRQSARTSFKGECLELEDETTQASSQVLVREFEDGLPDNDSGVEVLDSTIEGDIATLMLRHSGGCADHRFTLNIALPFMESQPLQTNASLTHHTEDTCEALVTTTAEFDLRPLQEVFRQEFQETSGEIFVGEFGLYQF